MNTFLASQEQQPDASYGFISGIVSDLPEGRIVVNRAVPGKPPELRTFIINPDTKVEGKLQVNSRVTVGFKTTDEGDVAVRIIVRAQNQRRP